MKINAIREFQFPDFLFDSSLPLGDSIMEKYSNKISIF